MIQNIKRKLFASPSISSINSLCKIGRCFHSQQQNSKPYISKLESRSLLVMHGPEAYKLLQGLTTNDMNLLSSKPIQSRNSRGASSEAAKRLSSDRVSLYTLFLSPKGKLITDAFIYKPKVFLGGKKQFRQDQLWIDVHSSAKKDLFFHLKKYMWKKEVELVDIDAEQDEHKPSVYAGFNHISTLSTNFESGMEIELKNQEAREEEYANMMMYDPRGGNFGRRIICMQEQFGIPANQFKLVPQSKYQDYQRTIGFTQTPLTRNKLPFQFNYDFLNAISFKKGCYLGQEIVSRSYFTGIVRRRVFPFIVNDEGALTEAQVKEIKGGAVLVNQDKEEVGKVVYFERNMTGLALGQYLSYFPEEKNTETISELSIGTIPTSDHVSNQTPKHEMMSVKINSPFDGVMFCPFHQNLKQYIEQTRSKQKTLQELDI